MIKFFFTLGADQSLKQVILASIPELLQNAVDRNLQQKKRNILQLTVGEIQQETFIALEELCDRKRIIKEYMSGSKELDKACKRPRLIIKCKKEHQCHCRSRGKKTFSRRYKRGSSKIPNFPDDEGNGKDNDMESIFSIEDEPSGQSLFAIQRLEDEQEDPTTEWSSEEGIYMLQSKISPKMTSIVPIPHVQASIYLGKFEKPISIIAFIDTGAAETIMNPDVLPSE
ncbi:hypothetical protein V6N12_010901 [Hibiscus sabdariffa]|uniref:Peptidase A2 domain-containing protein n=1 Tax=Hibiscus sabdariffa TaxID=183260 RepID=A0ABR2ELV7_9ROSI